MPTRLLRATGDWRHRSVAERCTLTQKSGELSDNAMVSLSYSEWARHGKWLLAKFNIPQACWDTLPSTVRDSSRFCLFMESMVASWLRPQLGCSWNLDGRSFLAVNASNCDGRCSCSLAATRKCSLTPALSALWKKGHPNFGSTTPALSNPCFWRGGYW